jgi:hypothetical protein
VLHPYGLGCRHGIGTDAVIVMGARLCSFMTGLFLRVDPILRGAATATTMSVRTR